MKHQWGLGGVVVQQRKSVGAAPRAGGRARVGRRMTHQVFLGLPWYLSDDYPALLALFSDPDKLPKTFDAWLKHAEILEKRLEAAGLKVAKILIQPAPFAQWCEERGVLPDQAARLTFANEAVWRLFPRVQ